MSTIWIKAIHCSASPGVEVGEALRSALRLAADEWRAVEVEHNGRIYRFDPEAMIRNAQPIAIERS